MNCVSDCDEQRKLRLVQALHEQQVAGGRDDDLASRRQLIDAGIGREKCRAHSDAGVAGHSGRAIALVLADVLQQVGIGREQPLRLDR